MGCRDRRETDVDSAPPVASETHAQRNLTRLGTAGRLGSERLMRLPRRMCPLGKGNVAWLLTGRAL